MRGGYAGCEEAEPDARNINQYETILSGDLKTDDQNPFINYSDNSFKVVRTEFGGCVLDGVVVMSGNADVSPFEGGALGLPLLRL